MGRTVKTVPERIQELHSKLLQNRIILIDGAVTQSNGLQIENMIDQLSSSNEQTDIYINSSGGSANAILALCNKIKKAPFPVSTLCLEEASGGASLILSSGTKGQRFALKSSRISLFHDLWIKDSAGKNLSEAGLAIIKIKEEIITLLSENTDKTKSAAETMISAAKFLSPQEALALGVIDHISGE